MEHSVKDMLGLELTTSLSFIQELIESTFPASVSPTIQLEASVLGMALTEDSEPWVTESTIIPLIKTYLFLQNHIHYLETPSSHLTLALMKGDILFSDSMNKVLHVSPALSSDLLNVADLALKSGFKLINQPTTYPAMALEHVQNMLPSFLQTGFRHTDRHIDDNISFAFGVATSLFADLSYQFSLKDTPENNSLTYCSYIKTATFNQSHTQSMTDSIDLILSRCEFCLNNASGSGSSNFITRTAEKILVESECLQKRLKLN